MTTPKIEVYKSIAAITGALAKEGISKDRKNLQQGFQYRGIDDVYAALSPLLAEHHLCILPRITGKEVVERVNAKGTALFYTTVAAEFDIVSAIDGSAHTVSSYGEAMDSGDKSIGKAMSYAYKAMAFMAFAIPTEGDNDPDAHAHEVKPQQRQAAAPPASIDPQDAAYHERIKTALKTIYGDDKQSALDKVEDLTTFTPKGKTEPVKGVRNFLTLKGDRAKYLAQNLEKLAKEAAADTPTCPQCAAILVDGKCTNTSCVPF